jgi:hypothetical protein
MFQTKSKMSMERKTEIPGIYKVADGILINKDNASLEAYKIRKHKDMKFVKLEEDISGLKQDMEEIKALLRGLVK